MTTAESEQRVTPLELFFDLVFVFAITEVTTMMAQQPTWTGLGRGMLVLSALWWAWASYSWLTNNLAADEGGTRLAMMAASAAALVASLAVPGAFGDDALVFAVAYTVLRVVHIVVYMLASPTEGIRHAIERLAPSFLTFCVLLIVAAECHGALQAGLWVAALGVQVGGLYLAGMEDWVVVPGHFAERHGLIVIIAIGESIVSVGVGASGLHVGWELIVAAVLGIAVSGALWWLYFDVVALVAERRLRAATGLERARLARDSYTHLHLLMIAGIVLLALGVKKTVAHTHDALDLIPAVGLCGGAALYLFAHVAFRLRNVHTWNPRRLAVGIVCVALIPLATSIPSLATLAIVAALLCALIAYEAIRFAEARERIRHAER